jgi:hypothetical protein
LQILFIKTKWLFISFDGFSAIENTNSDMFSEGNAVHLVGVPALQKVMAGWRIFFNLNFLSQV